ncbi:hypothetical protein BJ742DRAFT_821233 [Cladochytrium replicatum]|nr:hypothetical protein BJ742DRAFT_821233 [Cladochytrium replicatum]
MGRAIHKPAILVPVLRGRRDHGFDISFPYFIRERGSKHNGTNQNETMHNTILILLFHTSLERYRGCRSLVICFSHTALLNGLETPIRQLNTLQITMVHIVRCFFFTMGFVSNVVMWKLFTSAFVSSSSSIQVTVKSAAKLYATDTSGKLPFR